MKQGEGKWPPREYFNPFANRYPPGGIKRARALPPVRSSFFTPNNIEYRADIYLWYIGKLKLVVLGRMVFPDEMIVEREMILDVSKRFVKFISWSKRERYARNYSNRGDDLRSITPPMEIIYDFEEYFRRVLRGHTGFELHRSLCLPIYLHAGRPGIK